MKTRAIFAAMLLFAVTAALSHPGIGIVVDSKGNVYYTDLKHVWRLSPDGKKSVAVSNVHTHELYVDRDDNLYGEHLWYEGEASNKWGHRVWRLGADGTLTDIIPARPGFREDYQDFFFVRDGIGNMFWADRGESTVIRKRSPDGKITAFARGNFQNVRWMTASSEGTVYLVDLHDLVRITPGGLVHTIVHDLADRRRSFLLHTDTHAIMGLWTDSFQNAYAAVMSDRAVKKISPNGRVETVFRAGPGWTPTGGCIAPNGDLWLLEYSVTNSARVRRIDPSGKSRVFD